MYTVKPLNVKSFIENRKIRLPRFQRKLTWDDKDNFKLCISVFKNYPIGVCILSNESGRTSEEKWLLDGRQRKNALTKMAEDPENIYYWAQKFIKFRNNDQPDELTEKFWLEINRYLEQDEEEAADQETDVVTDSENTESEVTTEIVSISEIERTTSNKEGLDLLLEIIILIHNRKPKGTGFTIPFDFQDMIDPIPYLDNGSDRLSSK